VARDWQAVADAINTRLAELEMTQQELATRSGVSVSTLRQLQRGVEKRRGERTLADVSEALRLAPGHLAAVADGRASLPVAGEPEDEQALGELPKLRHAVEELSERLEAVERRLAEL
jgi:transcriptional regulator with XRE-family HTH domain